MDHNIVLLSIIENECTTVKNGIKNIFIENKENHNSKIIK